MKTAKIICSLLIALALYHFGVAILETGVRDGLGTDVYFKGYFANPWAAVIDFDLIAGLVLAASWVLWRERDRATALAWSAVLLYWGNLVVAIYVYRQLSRSQGDWTVFFLGKHATYAPPPAVPAKRPRWARWALRLVCWAVAAAIAGIIIDGCRSAHFAPASVMGYVWGLGSLIPPLILLARNDPQR